MSTSQSVRQPCRSNRRIMAVLARMVVDSSQRRAGYCRRPAASVCACWGRAGGWQPEAVAHVRNGAQSNAAAQQRRHMFRA